jgi:hypothetical protein
MERIEWKQIDVFVYKYKNKAELAAHVEHMEREGWTTILSGITERTFTRSKVVKE